MCSVSTCVLSALCVSGFVPGADSAGGAEIKAAQPGPVESRSLGVGPKLLMGVSVRWEGRKAGFSLWTLSLTCLLSRIRSGWVDSPSHSPVLHKASYIFIPTELAISYCTHFLHICLLFQIVSSQGRGHVLCAHTFTYTYTFLCTCHIFATPHRTVWGSTAVSQKAWEYVCMCVYMSLCVCFIYVYLCMDGWIHKERGMLNEYFNFDGKK